MWTIENSITAMIKNRLHFNKQGLTLTELIIAVAISAIIVPVTVGLLISVVRGFASYEATMQLKKTNRTMLNSIFLRLNECKRIFPRGDNYITACIQPALTIAPVSFTTLPSIIAATNNIYVSTGSAATGNALAFAINDMAVQLTATDGMSSFPINLSTYRFYGYYLADNTDSPLRSAPSYVLVEWKSIRYVDYFALSTMDTMKQAASVRALYAAGFRYAWLSSEQDTTQAFLALQSNGSLAINPSHIIQSDSNRVLTKAIRNQMVGGYRFAVAPNASQWGKLRKKIPQYAIANGSFPGGFEVSIIGEPQTRKVAVRSVLAAEGAMPSIIEDDQLIIASTRDVW
jgi:prepilin-type N-terminal cleavage/methylation domain-containing protein